jgi:RecA-family ATPase
MKQAPEDHPFLADVTAEYATRANPRQKRGNGPAGAFVQKYKDLATFLREYRPISYTLDSILPSGVFYFLTARRSTGKTAFFVAALFAIILGISEILGVKVKKGRVAYIALENPTDLRMKLEVARFHFAPPNVSLNDMADTVTIIDARLPPKDIIEQLTVATEKHGSFQAIFWDTFQAGFNGEEFNDNAGILKYAQQLRQLTELPGRPSLLVAAHPTKNAGEAELIPYGGGSSINEADGNLTLKKRLLSKRA